MRLLIAQGPGYYGVNVRILSDEEGAALEAAMDDTPPDGFPMSTSTEDGTVVILTGKVDIHKSTGFDTGWWEAGELALDEVIGKARTLTAGGSNG